jgi:PAS domain S-box-containing protein
MGGSLMTNDPTYEELRRRVAVLEKGLTARDRTEDMFVQEKEFSDAAIASVPGIFYMFDDTGKILRWNKNFEAVTGYCTEEVSRMHPLDLFAGGDKEKVAERIMETFTKGQSSVEADLVSKDGRKSLHLFTGIHTTIRGKSYLVGVGGDISVRSRMEEALRESEKRLIEAQRIAKMGDFTWDVGTGEVTWSDAMFDLLQYDKSETIDYGRVNAEIHHPDDLERVTQWLNDCLASGNAELSANEYRLIRKNGQVLYVRTVGSIEREGGKSAKVFATLQEITERKQAEEDLEASRTFLERVMQLSPFAMWVADEKGTVVRSNKSLRDTLNLTDEQLLGKYNVLKDDNLTDQGLMPRVRAVFEKLEPARFSMTWASQQSGVVDLKETRELLFIDVSMFPITSTEGRLTNVVCQWVDVSQRKRAEDELARTAQEWETTFDASNDAIWILDRDHRILRANKTAERMFRHPRTELVGSHCWEVVHGTTEPIPKCPLSRMERSMLRERMELQICEGWFEITVDPILDKTGAFSGAVHVVSDITARKQSEEKIRRSEEKYRELAENLNDVLFSVSEDGRITYVSPPVETVLGYVPAELLGKQFTKFVHSDDLDVIHLAFKDVVLGRLYPSEYRMRTKGGEYRWVRSSSRPVRGEEPTGALQGVLADITESKKAAEETKKLERQLRQVQKMESIGTLAGGIAHDFNNILGIIVGYAELASFDAAEGSKQRDNLGRITRAVRRGKDLASQILTFSRQEDQERKPIDVVPIIEEAATLLRASIPTSIEIGYSLQVASGVISGDPTQIHQVLLNLCTNARQAMAERGGVLKIELAEKRLEPADLLNYPELNPGTYLKFTLSDTGCGMDKETLERIFEPYFTTKDTGDGTGLGLSVTLGIVRSHGGTIRAYSEPGKGTTFHVLLPRIAEEPSPEAEETRDIATTRVACILFVDDEEELVEYGRQVLENLGHEVITETSSMEALEIFRRQPNRFDLVITDMTMPKLSGVAFSRELFTIRPDIPIILCTGFSEAINHEKARAIGIRELLMKPVLIRDLIDAIRKIFPE